MGRTGRQHFSHRGAMGGGLEVDAMHERCRDGEDGPTSFAYIYVTGVDRTLSMPKYSVQVYLSLSLSLSHSLSLSLSLTLSLSLSLSSLSPSFSSLSLFSLSLLSLLSPSPISLSLSLSLSLSRSRSRSRVFTENNRTPNTQTSCSLRLFVLSIGSRCLADKQDLLFGRLNGEHLIALVVLFI